MKTKLIFTFLTLLFLTGCQCTPLISSSTPTTNGVVNGDNSTAPSPQNKSFERSGNHQILQIGNNSPSYRLTTIDSESLLDNHTGAWTGGYDLYDDPKFIFENGFKRIRIGGLFHPNQTGWPIREDTLLEEIDEAITEYAENGVTVVLATQAGSGLPFPMDEFTQDDIDIMLDYVTFLATHFKGRIEYYEIFNEFGHIYEIDTYVNLVNQTTERIKQIDPNAKVIIGAVPGNWLNEEPGYGEFQRFILDTNFLFELIRITNFTDLDVDGISWHPLYDNLPTDPYYQHYPEIIRAIRSFAEIHQYQGDYFADEILWVPVDEENWDNGPPTDPKIGAKYITRTITEHRGLGINVSINKFWHSQFIEPIKYLNNVLAGAEPIDLSYIFETSEAFDHMRVYEFLLPSDEILLAVWINDTAVFEDAGLNFTLTLPDFSTDTATGVDIYYGFEQELLVDNANGDLTIQNLMVKDYPTFIRFNGPVYPSQAVSTKSHLPTGNVIIVENTTDSGPGTLRQALLDATSGDTIKFDPVIFPPENPASIFVLSGLPWIEQGYLTIDASDAGVILDGTTSGAAGLEIASAWNSIKGLHIINFPRPGILVWENASFTTIGGDPSQGAGPLGQGNLISGNFQGIVLRNSIFNTITGNQIGAELGSTAGNQEQAGISIEGKSIGNTIGPENIIVNNKPGVHIVSVDPMSTTISRNLIFDNNEAILYEPGVTGTPDAPEIITIDPSGSVSGTACPHCRVEIFSGNGAGAEYFIGSQIADSDGDYYLDIKEPFTGTFLIAAATTPVGDTSALSAPAAIQ